MNDGPRAFPRVQRALDEKLLEKQLQDDRDVGEDPPLGGGYHSRVPTRRTILKLGVAPFVLGRAPLMRTAGPRVVVIGAGAFGGWTALWLARRGAQVTIIDAWGPGNMRASSGGETRVIRGFPALANAPLLGGEVCQYENSPDAHFIVDRHPAASNVWIVGGGSGHGFKMGPALGEMVAPLVLSDGTADPQLRLSRLARQRGQE